MATRRIRLAFEGLPTSYRRGVERAAIAAEVLADDGPVVTLLPLGSDPDGCAGFEQSLTGTIVLALLDPFDRESVRHAIAHGVACADLQAEPEDVVAAAVAAAEGRVLLPVSALDGLAGVDPHAALRVTPEERRWLAALAHGATVVRIADDFGYSERAMFRRLADLYSRLGVKNRDEAISAAHRAGLLDD